MARVPQCGRAMMNDTETIAACPVGDDDATVGLQVTSRDVQKHLDLVNQVVARFVRKLPANVDRGDLVAAGMYGLVTSLERNGGDGGETFEGYARLRIRGAILDELRAQDWLSRRARWAAADDSYEGPRVLVGFEDVADAERERSFADADAPDALALLEAAGTRNEIDAALARLPDRERAIVARHYFEGVPFKTLAAEWRVSEPRISQIHTRALGRLKGILGRDVRAA
jgi:RNA polymerase sigma factor for flagellar operon FliA